MVFGEGWSPSWAVNGFCGLLPPSVRRPPGVSGRASGCAAASPTCGGVRGHTPLQVEPAGQSCILVPLHWIVQEVFPPHTTAQPEAPAHSAVHPPCGQLMLHVLSP